MSKKTLYQSKTFWGLLVSLIFGLLAQFDIRVTDSEAESVVQAFGVIFGFALGLYGRIRAVLPIGRPDTDMSQMMTLAICLLLGAGALPIGGCATYRDLSPTTQTALHTSAKIALHVALYALVDQVPEIRPYQPALKVVIDTAFAEATAEQIGQSLKSGVLSVVADAALQAIILDSWAIELTPDTAEAGTTAEAPQTTFNWALASALR